MKNIENVNYENFDPMAESSWTPEMVTKEEFEVIKKNENKVIDFNKKFGKIRAKYEATFVDGILSENDWTEKDASEYQNYLNEKKNIPTDKWNTSQYKVSE